MVGSAALHGDRPQAIAGVQHLDDGFKVKRLLGSTGCLTSRSAAAPCVQSDCQRVRAKRDPMTGSASNPEISGSGSTRRRVSRNDGGKPPSTLLQVDPCCRGGRMDTRTPSTTHLTDEQRVDCLRLIRSDNVGPRGIMAQTPQAGVWRRSYPSYPGDTVS